MPGLVPGSDDDTQAFFAYRHSWIIDRLQVNGLFIQ
jgi:hypothetical protein